MKISLHAVCTGTFVPLLTSLAGVLDKAAEHAKAKNFDPSILAKARLAPDMFPLWAQVLIACRYAATVTGVPPEGYDNRELAFDELKPLVEKTIAGVKAARWELLEGAEDRDLVIPMPPSTIVLEVTGAQLVIDWALPHFYFHVVTAYDILRHNGVAIGKRDYLGDVERFIRDRG